MLKPREEEYFSRNTCGNNRVATRGKAYIDDEDYRRGFRIFKCPKSPSIIPAQIANLMKSEPLDHCSDSIAIPRS